MSSTVMSIKIDKNLKERAMKVAKKMGFSLSTLMKAYLHQLIRDQVVNFSTFPSHKMSKPLEKSLDTIEKDIHKNNNISPAFTDSDKAIDYLDNDENAI